MTDTETRTINRRTPLTREDGSTPQAIHIRVGDVLVRAGSRHRVVSVGNHHAGYDTVDITTVPADEPAPDHAAETVKAGIREHAEFMTGVFARGYRPLGGWGLMVCGSCFAAVPTSPAAVDGHDAWHAQVTR